MFLKGIRPVVVLIALIIGLVVIFGTQYMVQTKFLEEPFKKKVLSIDGIEDVKLIETENGKQVYLIMRSDVELKDAFLEVNRLAQEMLSGRIEIKIENQVSQDMKELYKRMHFVIYEGIASGKFTWMAAQLEAIGLEAQLQDLDVQVDNNFVYVKMIKNGEVFCKVVPRKAEGLAYMKEERGESQW
ncbi:hypothetical protein BBF96_03645 [Anoxybacter fermentans]|uniref:Uncharacterized protein n=1 Tax=Anoxybacter fermentans TaxID=1323375 RepID=A0A3S9SW63_9FIRM|nr:hypothetical protein [Anoxybacter fermentans]AZR72556.1 hypothetical protein BBF96_03645 [Anoxybacter fermentans]